MSNLWVWPSTGKAECPVSLQTRCCSQCGNLLTPGKCTVRIVSRRKRQKKKRHGKTGPEYRGSKSSSFLVSLAVPFRCVCSLYILVNRRFIVECAREASIAVYRYHQPSAIQWLHHNHGPIEIGVCIARSVFMWVNGFYFFMLDMQQELRQQGRSVPMRDMPVVAGPKWSVSIIFKHYPHDHSNLTLIYNTETTWYRKAGIRVESQAGKVFRCWSHIGVQTRADGLLWGTAVCMWHLLYSFNRHCPSWL